MKLRKCLLFREMTLMVRYKVGIMVVGFWNAYNVCTSFVVWLIVVILVFYFHRLFLFEDLKYHRREQTSWRRRK